MARRPWVIFKKVSDAGRQYIKHGEKMLGILRQRMERDGTQNGVWRRTLADGTKLKASIANGIEVIKIQRPGEEEEAECKVYMESGRLTKIVLNEADPDMAATAQLEYGDTVEDWLASHTIDPWVGEVANG